ncbi:DUF7768 domain-containing protein [Brevibacterium antiquum]
MVLESPFAGDTPTNLAYARAAMHDSLMRGEAPFASHMLYTQSRTLMSTNADWASKQTSNGWPELKVSPSTSIVGSRRG